MRENNRKVSNRDEIRGGRNVKQRLLSERVRLKEAVGEWTRNETLSFPTCPDIRLISRNNGRGSRL